MAASPTTALPGRDGCDEIGEFFEWLKPRAVVFFVTVVLILASMLGLMLYWGARKVRRERKL